MAASRSRSRSASASPNKKSPGKSASKSKKETSALSLGGVLTPSVCPIYAKSSSGRFLAANLLGGVLQCLVSCLLGLVPPTAVGWYAMMVKTHVAFMMNGFLAMLLSFVGPEIGKSLSDDQMKVWALTMQLGTWFNGLAHLKGAISGTKAPMVRSMGRAPYGEDAVMEGMLMFCGVNIIVALVLTCWGLHKRCKA